MCTPLLFRRPTAAVKRLVLTALPLLSLAVTSAQAQQASSYSFSQSNGTYTPITGGTVLGTATVGGTAAASLDDVIYTLPAGTIPFTFTFNGTGYTGMNVSTNGFITFGATAPTASDRSGISNTTAYEGAIVAVGRDLQGIVTAGNLGEVRYETIGTAPNRTFVVQYSNFRVYANTTDDFDFQIRLKETSNVAEIVYGSFTVGSTGTVQVGLRGATNADFNNRTSTTSWTATAPGTSNGAGVTLTSMILPPSGLTFTFTPPGPTDAGIAGVFAPAVPFSAGTQPLTLVLRNYGSAPLTNVVINYSINGVAQTPFTFTGTIPAFGSQNVTVGNFTFPAGTSTITASTALAGDSNPSNDSFTTTVTTALSGTYTINNTQPTGGTNFASFTAAINALNPAGASGAVTFLVSNGQVFAEDAPALTASGTAASPIVFREATLSGSNVNPKITPAGGPGSADAGIILSGADYITFDGIDIDASAGSAVEAGYVVRNASGTDGATNNTIRNAAITLNRTNTASMGLVQSSNTSAGGVATTASAASGVNQNNTYRNLTITNAFSGVWLYGATVGFADRGTELSGLTIGSDPLATGATLGDIGTGGGTSTSTVYGVRALNQTALSIHNNVIRNIYANTTVYGLLVDNYSGSGADAGNVYSNRISGVRNNSTTSTASAFGINVSLSGSAAITLNVYNNFVSDITSAFTGTATATRVVRGIHLASGGSSASTINVVYNSVRIDSGSLNVSSTAYEIASVTTTGINTRNNIFANFTGPQTTAKHYAFITTSTAGLVGNTGSVSNYNDLYVANTGNGFVGATGTPSLTATTNDRASLAAWQMATTQDANSLSIDPLFASATDLHLQGGSGLNNAGTPVAGITTDIDGQTRNATTPDMGADEFAPLNVDLGAVALLSPGTATACFSATEAVTVQVRNNGLAPLNFATTPATITVVLTPATGPAQTLTATLTNGTLAAGTTQDVTLPGTADLTGLGTYSFAVTATVAGDQNTGNDVLSPAPTRVVSAPVAGTLAAPANSFCGSGSTTLSLTGNDNGSVQLQSSPDNMTFTDIAMATGNTFTTPTLSQTTYYRAQVRCNGRVATSNIVTVTVSNPQATTITTPLAICSGSSATLTATAPAGTTLQFFDAATGGTALSGSTTTGTTTTLATGPLTTSRQYFVQATTGVTETVGRTMPSGISNTTASNHGLVFNATSAFTLNSVDVYPTGAAGNLVVQVQDNTGTLIPGLTATVAIPAGTATTPFTVPLNFSVPAGTGLRLIAVSSPNLVRETSGATFPYTSPSGLVTITSGYFVGTSQTYYYFYNWQISNTCTGTTRTAIQVNVTPQPAMPTIAQATQPNGTVVLTSSAATGNQFFLNGQPITGATGQTYTVTSPALNGSYTVTTTANSCSSAPSAAVTVAVVLGARSALAGSSLHVYPNPSPNGHLTVELHGYRQTAGLTVLNVLGQEVRRLTVAPGAAGQRTLDVDLSALPAGVYTLRVASQDGTATRRVVRE